MSLFIVVELELINLERALTEGKFKNKILNEL